ncbi:susd and RagB outer membrane lipoprotein [mine drainage metagenome]|uniref:Susd and RagB outer membrane lipoprotein n=1 Tax=mine drainage metagenome TaxID=410659 RepID=A0A1J5SVV6_9ZZZZ
MKKYIKILFVSALLAGTVACNKEMNSLLNNPNYPSPATADVDLYLNTVQLNFNNFYSTASDFGGQLSRQQMWFGPQYVNAWQPSSFDGEWSTAYTGVISNANSLIPLAEAQNKFIQAGIARVLKAYTMGTLVDDFGDVPLSKSELGADNTNPSVDGGAAIYASVQAMLDSAIIDFSKPGATKVPSDLFYGGSAAKWTALANTLKLKFYMQTRLVDNTAVAKIQALITANNLINSASQDFQFQYGTNLTSPDSRHPHYAADYISGGGGEYLANYFMWKVVAQKYNGTVSILKNNTTANNADPRARYYFYREIANSAPFSQTSVPCAYVPSPPSWYPAVPTATPFCYVGSGYFGRDYGDNSGTSPDQAFRTEWGIYPAGGQWDGNQYTTVSLGYGAGGAGISPIWLSSYTMFLEAEAALTLGITTNGTAATLLQNGINASISKVLAFPATIGYSVPAATATTPGVPTAAQITNYVTMVMNNFNTGTAAQQLDIVESEYFIAAWGNGVEPYNNIRRTGSPLDVQIAVSTPTPGIFMRSFFYPSVFVNRNVNAPAQKTPGTAANKVFWDNNPDNFIK